ncbi:MAG TPA: MauE/DoxX family redox-associated membrane protein [Kribbella sp.]|uniref:MauE/DoxX family redox-associated membrane protein n=1 Tax=Kribbella sp. TaxID=1871183 RepID=UPI002D79ED22|nr:MauE/DoxX family redox-associated membrane protein [Kribbella sp.]HET6295867.1 MauE/DoxX family redox-associated membrane protein [Kribbella sp.]
MIDALIASFTLAGALLLLLAASRRTSGNEGLTEVVRQHGLLPDRLARHAIAGTAFEAVIGSALIIGWLSGEGWLTRLAATAVATWFLFLAVYLAALLRRRGRVPCGCLDDKSPVNPIKIIRATLLAATAALLAAGLPALPSELAVRLLYVATGGFIVVLLITIDRVTELLDEPATGH